MNLLLLLHGLGMGAGEQPSVAVVRGCVHVGDRATTSLLVGDYATTSLLAGDRAVTTVRIDDECC